MERYGGNVHCNYRDPEAPVEDRIKDLLSRMSIGDKIGQMIQIVRQGANPTPLTDTIRKFHVGGILNAPGSGPHEDAVASQWAEMVDDCQRTALKSRLGIPIIYGIDAVHGNNSVYGATIFPHNIGLGATRDAELARKIGEATALEVRASGIHSTFAPCVAVCRNPMWGRCYESFSDDTEIVRKMTSIVTGLQGKQPDEYPKGYPFVAGRNNVIACAKHFVGDGGTERGINEGNTVADYKNLKSIHIAPYLDCIARGISTIMASSSSWNGDRIYFHRFLLTEVLKEKLGFKGFIISGGLRDPRVDDYRERISLAVNAGIDMVEVSCQYDFFVEKFIELVQLERIPASRIDDAVERILRVKFVAGLFEYPFADRNLLDRVGCQLHRDLAREAVRKSLVLLKNGKSPRRPFLPLDRNAQKILVVGKHADDLGYQCGGWTCNWTGKSGRITVGTTILDAIREAVSAETEVIFETFPSRETLTRRDISFAIVAVGEQPYAEMYGYDSELVIPSGGPQIIESLPGRIRKLVILISGRPLVLTEMLLEKMDALVAAWLPGSEGRGITDVIFGNHEFEGRLPVTWFREVEQLHAGVNSYDPLFPRGFGLTYHKDKSH